MNALLQQAQQMQEQLEDAQAAARRDRRSRARSAAALVTVTVNGVGELVGVEIKAGGFDGSTPTTSPTSAT